MPTSAPSRLAAEGPAPQRLRIPPAIRPGPGAIEGDILLVDDEVLTLPDVLYPLQAEIEEARRTQTAEGFVNVVRRTLEIHVQQAIGAILIYREAMAGLSEPQRAMVDDAVEREIQRRISREFGDSQARFEHHLAQNGLTVEQYRKLLEREMVARQYTREKLLPQVFVRRDELWREFQQRREQYSSAEVRTLLMIEAPFVAFLPEGLTWDQASDSARAQARLRAKRHIDAAQAALADRPFDEVAREMSRGVHAAQGGLWGEIGRPLQAPYDRPSALVFELAEGAHSEPLETEQGWYIVQCGHITPAKEVSFADVQEQIREALIEQKFAKLSADYMIRLASQATISSMDAFIQAGLRRVREPSATGDVR